MTSGALLPRRVLSACRLLIQQVFEDRNMLLLEQAAKWKHRHPLWWFCSTQKIVDSGALPKYLCTAIDAYRQADIAVAFTLRDLARAIQDDDSTLRMEVDAHDFAVIKRYYTPEK